MSNQIDMFTSLRAAGVNSVYRRAEKIIASRGRSSTLVLDPYTGSVDAYGAILLACGADPQALANGDIDPVSCGAPESSIKPIVLAVEYIESHTNSDISEWSASTEVHDIRATFGRLADRIDIAVVGETDLMQ